MQEFCLRLIDICFIGRGVLKNMERKECMLDTCVRTLFIRQNTACVEEITALFGMSCFFPRKSAGAQHSHGKIR